MSDTAPISSVRELAEAITRTHAELAASDKPGVSVSAPSACPELVERARPELVEGACPERVEGAAETDGTTSRRII